MNANETINRTHNIQYSYHWIEADLIYIFLIIALMRWKVSKTNSMICRLAETDENISI